MASAPRVNATLLVGQFAGMLGVFGLILFGAAGTLAWPAGWVFLALFLGLSLAITVWLWRNNPGLLVERMTGIGKQDQKTWDKVFYVIALGLFLVWMAVMALDAVRFQWSLVPTWVQVVGAALLTISFYLFFLTFRENSFLSPAVRIQSERGQRVISTGLYRYVRHPMYAGVIPFAAGTSLLLGSVLGLAFAVVILVAIARRAVLEERTLCQELAGYEDYMKRVRYRFLPRIW